MTQARDPVCPECGEGVGSTSTYCMHCDAEFDAPATRTAASAGGGDAASGSKRSDAASADATPNAVVDYGTTGEGYDGDHPLDGAARVVGLALTVLLGLAATFTLVIAFAQRASIWLPLALLALAGTAALCVHVWRLPTGRGALARALYLDAAGLVVVPVAFGLLADADDSVTVGVILAVVFGGIGVVAAVPVALVAYWLTPDRV